MRKTSRFQGLKAGLALGLIGAMGMAFNAQAADKKVLKFAVFTPEKELTFQQVMKPWADKVMKDAGGELDVQLFPNGALGRHPGKQLKMVNDGVADIAWVIPAYTPGRFPDNSVFELPNVIKTSKEGSIAAWRLYKKGMLRGYEKYYVIGLFTTAPYTFHTKFKVASMADLKGRKIRAVGPAMVASVKAIGAAPEPMPFTKIVEAISRGRIDGTTAHPIALHDFGVAKVTSSHYFGRLGTVNLAIMMNRKVYEGLSAKAKAAIDKHSGEAMSIAFGNMSDGRNDELRKMWSKEGKRTVTMQSDADAKAWDKALAPVISDWSGKHPKGQALLSALKSELKAIRTGN